VSVQLHLGKWLHSSDEIQRSSELETGAFCDICQSFAAYSTWELLYRPGRISNHDEIESGQVR